MTDRTERLRRMAAVGMLTRSYAHEFNNVLGGILGIAQLLSMRSEDPDLRARLATIVASVQRGIALTSALATMAQGGRAVAEPTDAHALLRELLDEQALPAGTTLELGATKPRILGDRDALREALIVLAQTLSMGPESPAGIAIETINCSSASSHEIEGMGDALPWLRISLSGDRAPSSEQRRLIEQPLSSCDGDAGVLLAGAGAVVKQARGRVMVDDGSAEPRILVFLPTV